jgi:hypothetical protein
MGKTLEGPADDSGKATSEIVVEPSERIVRGAWVDITGDYGCASIHLNREQAGELVYQLLEVIHPKTEDVAQTAPAPVYEKAPWWQLWGSK